MKLLLVLLAVLAGVWLWRRGQRQGGAAMLSRRQRNAQPAQTLVPCAHCGVLVAEADAARGPQGWYCCDAHRRQAGQGG